LLIGLVAVGMSAAGCSSPQAAPPVAISSAPATPSATTAAGQRLATGGFCLVDLPAPWKQALVSGLIKHQPGESLIVKAVAPDGSLFADSFLDGSRSMVWLHHVGAERRMVMRLSNPEQQVFGAAFDGRWLVFSVFDQPILDSLWTMYAWDSSAGGNVRTISRSVRPGPFPYPSIYDGKAFWSQAVTAERSELHQFDLKSGIDRVINAGVPGYPFLYGRYVVWPEMVPGNATAPIDLQAADAATGQAVDLPPELKVPLARPSFENADANTFVWSTNNLATLKAWHNGDAAPTTIIAQAPSGSAIQWPQVARDLVTWDNGAAQFVADLRSGSYAQVTPEFGSILLAKDAMVVAFASAAPAKQHPVLESASLMPSKLPPLPTCK
jgi:hypothetical protein